jgi:tRNA(Ile)-lysidine synthase TilS/MesJ
VHDGSNDDTRYLRNRLRAEVMPALRATAPDADLVLASAARA